MEQGNVQEHVLNDEEYQLFQRLQDLYQQRVMGLGGGTDNIISKVTFNGKNAEEFNSKFPHIATSHQVYRNLGSAGFQSIPLAGEALGGGGLVHSQGSTQHVGEINF